MNKINSHPTNQGSKQPTACKAGIRDIRSLKGGPRTCMEANPFLLIGFAFTVFMIAAILSGCGFPSFSPSSAAKEGSGAFEIPDARQQLILKEAIIREKLNTALLPAMRNHDIDMWIICDRENNPDPLHDELGGGYSGTGAVYLFIDNGSDGVEKIFFAPSEQPLDSPISRIYDKKIYYGNDPGELGRLLRREAVKRNPGRIAVNVSTALASADGLTVSLEHFVTETLGVPFSERMVSSERVVHEFRSSRVSEETELYRRLQEWTDAWEISALKQVVPEKTTVLDLWCSLVDRAAEKGLSLITDHGRFPMIVWYCDQEGMPGLSAFTSSRPLLERGMPQPSERDFPIEPGDLITLDGGLRFLGFSSDMKRTAYALKSGESGPPAALGQAWRKTLEVAKLYAEKLIPGTTGREVWRILADELRSQGIGVAGTAEDGIGMEQVQASFYGHSVGSATHDVGARVAPGGPHDFKSELPLIEGEWVSVEFHLTTPDPNQPGKRWFTRFEQTGQVGTNGLKWLIPLQETLLLIGSAPSP